MDMKKRNEVTNKRNVCLTSDFFIECSMPKDDEGMPTKFWIKQSATNSLLTVSSSLKAIDILNKYLSNTVNRSPKKINPMDQEMIQNKCNQFNE